MFQISIMNKYKSLFVHFFSSIYYSFYGLYDNFSTLSNHVNAHILLHSFVRFHCAKDLRHRL